MVLTIKDIELKTRLPKLPSSMPLFELDSPSLEMRKPAINLFSEILNLKETTKVELKDSVVFASKRGEIEYFPASGSIWSRDTTVDEKRENEECKWKGLEKQEQNDEVNYVLNETMTKRLSKQAHDLLKRAELLTDFASFAAVELDQFAQFDEKSKEISSGAGPATIKYLYRVEGIPVYGPGAKTLVFAEPEDGKPRITGAFHAWRDIGKSRKLKLPEIEKSLAVGLLQDPELMLHHKKGHKIEITSLEFGYFAMPAFIRQSFLFPAYQIEGSIVNPKDESRFFFGKYHHAVAPRQYIDVKAHAYYLFSQL